MRYTRRFICAALAVVLLASVLLPAKAADVYYYGVGGRRLFPCTYKYMPMQTSDGLMCPVNLLLEGGLGLNGSVSERDDSYTLSYTAKSGQYLTFYLNKAGSFDPRWTYNDKSLIKKNGVYYVPLAHVAERLGFSAESFSTQYGTVVRVSTANDTMTNADVERSIRSSLADAQESYRLMNGTQLPEPKLPPNVYLGFDADMDGNVADVLDILEAQGITATFFITPEYAERGDVRNIIVRGHALGIRFDGGEELDALTYANEALRFSALTQTRILRLPEDSAADHESLKAGGYRLWEWKLDGQSRNIFKTIDNAKNACYVRFGCDDESIEALNSLLVQLKTLDTEYYVISEAQPPVFS